MSDPTPPAAELLPPGLAARFDAERALGEGMCGRVVLARDRELTRTVAIKLLFSKWAEKTDSAERFRREAEYMGRIRSPRVAEVYDHGIDGRQPFMVTRFIEGPDLKDYLVEAGGTLPFDRATRIFRQVLEGLEAIHQADVVHRDLKPANIMLDQGGDAVITDFGLGRAIGDETLTRTGALVGTPAFMAPEQMQGVRAGKDVDLYAAVLVWIQLLTGKIAMIGTDLPTTLAKRTMGLPFRLRDKGFDVPEPVEELVARTTDPDPARRPPDATTFLAAFEAAMEGEPLPDWSVPADLVAAPPLQAPASAGSGPPSAAFPRLSSQHVPPPDSSRRRVIAVSLVGTCLVVGVLWGLLSPSPAAVSPPPAAVTVDGGGEPGVAAAPAEEPAALLARIREELDEDLGIREAMALNLSTPKEAALEIWRSARVSFRRIVRGEDLEGAVEALREGPLSFEVLEDVSRILLLQRLLSTTEHEVTEPLWTDRADPGLDAIVDRAAQLRREPALGGSVPSNTGRRVEHYRRSLPSRGQDWRPLRTMEGILTTINGRAWYRTWILLQNPAGEVFRDPVGEVPELVVQGISSSFDRDRYKVTEPVIEVSPEPVEGDLYLSAATAGSTDHDQLWVDLVGEDEVLSAALVLPRYQGARTDEEGHDLRLGVALRFREEFLPAGLHTVRFRVFALQPIGRVLAVLHVEEIYQLVGGPPPEVFRE